MNAAKSIVMVCRRTVVGYSEHVSVVSVGKKYKLRYVYRKSIIARSVVCTWSIIIDSRCFMCNRCDSTTQEAHLSSSRWRNGVGCVTILCYPGDTLHGRDLATTA